MRFLGAWMLVCAGACARAEAQAPGVEPRSVAIWLARAGAPQAAEREQAQRWLAANLVLADVEDLVAAPSLADAEVRARVARALGGEPRHLELALALAVRTEDSAAEAGREALREQILAWDPLAEEPAAGAEDWLPALERLAPERLALPAELGARASERVLDLLARHAPGAPPLVFDPAAGSGLSQGAGAPREAGLPELLLRVAAERGLDVAGFGFAPRAREGGRRWLLLTPRGAGPSPRPLELLALWLRCVAGRAEPGARRAAARALAATGWPAALALLERRWIDGDPVALDGLLLAAGQGRVARALQDPERQRALYGMLREAAGGEPAARDAARADELVRALAVAGPVSPAGVALGDLALEGFETAGARERWCRLAILEGQQRAFTGALERVAAVLAASDSPPGLVAQALRTQLALAPAAAPPALDAHAGALLEWAGDARRLDELRRSWRALSPGWPAAWNQLSAFGSAVAPESRGFLVEAAWIAGAREPALAEARVLLRAGSDAALEALRRALEELELASGTSAAADLLQELRADARGAEGALAALARLARLAPAPADEAALARWIETGPATALEAHALGRAAAGTRGAEAREALLALLGSRLGVEARVAALGEAARALAVQGADSERARFVAAVRARARALDDAELRARLRPDRWPPAAREPVIDLAREERGLERW